MQNGTTNVKTLSKKGSIWVLKCKIWSTIRKNITFVNEVRYKIGRLNEDKRINQDIIHIFPQYMTTECDLFEDSSSQKWIKMEKIGKLYYTSNTRVG